jgi:hypothetical protein
MTVNPCLVGWLNPCLVGWPARAFLHDQRAIRARSPSTLPVWALECMKSMRSRAQSMGGWRNWRHGSTGSLRSISSRSSDSPRRDRVAAPRGATAPPPSRRLRRRAPLGRRAWSLAGGRPGLWTRRRSEPPQRSGAVGDSPHEPAGRRRDGCSQPSFGAGDRHSPPPPLRFMRPHRTRWHPGHDRGAHVARSRRGGRPWRARAEVSRPLPRCRPAAARGLEAQPGAVAETLGTLLRLPPRPALGPNASC